MCVSEELTIAESRINHWRPLGKCCLWLFVAESDVCFKIQVVIEQLGEDASKHEHRYLVYCHKIVVESSVLDKSLG